MELGWLIFVVCSESRTHFVLNHENPLICLDILKEISGFSRMSRLTFPYGPRAQIRSNVYNNSDHIAQPEPVFLRMAFMTFYPTLEINQPS